MTGNRAVARRMRRYLDSKEEVLPMTRFGITRILIYGNNHPSVITSEPDDLQVVYEALQALLPSARMTKNSDYSWSQSPQMVEATFDHLDGNHNEVTRWLVAKFADLGWEPYALSNTG